jgi:hypothetical protein
MQTSSDGAFRDMPGFWMTGVRSRMLMAGVVVAVAAAIGEVAFADYGREHTGWGWIGLGAIVIVGGILGRSWWSALAIPAAFTLGLAASDVWLGAHGSRPVGWDLFDHDPISHTVFWVSVMFFGASQFALFGTTMRIGGRELRLLAHGQEPDGRARLGLPNFGSSTDRIPIVPAMSDMDGLERPSITHDAEMEHDRRRLEISIEELKRYHDRMVIQRAVSEFGIFSICAAIFVVGVLCGVLVDTWMRSL